MSVRIEGTKNVVENAPEPEVCPECKGELKSSTGYVGEQILYCPEHGIVWEDAEDAIRRVA